MHVAYIPHMQHPNHKHFILTEFAENGSLHDYMHIKHNSFDLQQGLQWAKQVAEGVISLISLLRTSNHVLCSL